MRGVTDMYWLHQMSNRCQCFPEEHRLQLITKQLETPGILPVQVQTDEPRPNVVEKSTLSGQSHTSHWCIELRTKAHVQIQGQVNPNQQYTALFNKSQSTNHKMLQNCEAVEI